MQWFQDMISMRSSEISFVQRWIARGTLSNIERYGYGRSLDLAGQIETFMIGKYPTECID